MNLEEAKILLSFHSSRNEDINNPLWDNGFVKLLRSFKDIESLETVFHEVMKIVYTLSDYLVEEKVKTDIISDFWSIVHLRKCGDILIPLFLQKNKKKLKVM